MVTGDITGLADRIAGTASAAGMIVYPAAPRAAELPVLVDWPRDWESFVHCASNAGAQVVYLERESFHPTDAVALLAERLGIQAEKLDDPLDEEVQWLRQRVSGCVSKWITYEGQDCCVLAIWFRDGVAHGFQATAQWYEDLMRELTEVGDGCQQILTGDRQTRSADDAARLLECAKKMADDDRYASATNAAKRQYMARELFPSEDDQALRRIVELASVYDWWSNQASQGPSLADKVKDLWDCGESVDGIARALKVDVGQVNKALRQMR